MSRKSIEISRRDFFKKSAALGGALAAPYIHSNAFAATRDRVTVYQNTQADSINPYQQSSGSIYGNWQHGPYAANDTGHTGVAPFLARGDGLSFDRAGRDPGGDAIGDLVRTHTDAPRPGIYPGEARRLTPLCLLVGQLGSHWTRRRCPGPSRRSN